ncbi:hypothetical protein ZHAS_00016587 [Anopheles sinensis]|uniref:Uncharacterized protein n=1 Tax=Anopheles sinensis TaxID=74873 RepID=A0A084WEF6_ANOSI|nr:hypothetical protein ZHAS_00016587 [Anopheles sinensis]
MNKLEQVWARASPPHSDLTASPVRIDYADDRVFRCRSWKSDSNELAVIWQQGVHLLALVERSLCCVGTCVRHAIGPREVRTRVAAYQRGIPWSLVIRRPSRRHYIFVPVAARARNVPKAAAAARNGMQAAVGCRSRSIHHGAKAEAPRETLTKGPDRNPLTRPDAIRAAGDVTVADCSIFHHSTHGSR